MPLGRERGAEKRSLVFQYFNTCLEEQVDTDSNSLQTGEEAERGDTDRLHSTGYHGWSVWHDFLTGLTYLKFSKKTAYCLHPLLLISQNSTTYQVILPLHLSFPSINSPPSSPSPSPPLDCWFVLWFRRSSAAARWSSCRSSRWPWPGSTTEAGSARPRQRRSACWLGSGTRYPPGGSKQSMGGTRGESGWKGKEKER